jgi:hypothetical protein
MEMFAPTGTLHNEAGSPAVREVIESELIGLALSISYLVL